MIQIRDLISRRLVDIDPEDCEAKELLLYTVFVLDKKENVWRQFLIGDALMAGIELPEPKTLTEFAEGGGDVEEP